MVVSDLEIAISSLQACEFVTQVLSAVALKKKQIYVVPVDRGDGLGDADDDGLGEESSLRMVQDGFRWLS